MYPADSSLLVVWSHELLYDASLEGQRYYEATVFLHWLRVRQPGCQKLSDHLACTTHPINNHCVLIHVIVHLVCYTRPEIFKKWEFYTFYILNKNLTVTANFLSRKLLLTKTRSSAIAKGPRNGSCQLKSGQLPRNSAETTYTTSPGQIDGMKLEI